MENYVEEKSNFVEIINNAKSIEDATSAVLKLGLILNGQLSIRNFEICKRRFKWVLGKERMLDEIGKEFGITRERVRQVQNKCGPISVNFESTPLIFQKLLFYVKQSNSEFDLINSLKSQNLIQTGDWNLETFGQLSKVINFTELSEEIVNFKKDKVDFFSDPKNIKKVQKLRSKIGIIDIDLLGKTLDIDISKSKSMILSVYKRSIFNDNLCLARGSLSTTYEAVLFKQLLIKSPLSAEELYEGVLRECSGRRYQSIGTKEENYLLIKKLCGEEPSLESLRNSSGDDFAISSMEKWMVLMLNSSPLGMLHTNEWIVSALKSGKKTGSMTKYLSTSPVLRPLGRGIYTSVGKRPVDSDIDNYSRMIENTSDKLEIKYKFESDKLLLEVKPSLGAIAGGSLPIKKDLLNLIQANKFEIHCSCNKLQSESQIKVKSGSFWTGFAAFFRHHMEIHKNDVRKELIIVFDFDLETATLQI